MAKGHGPGRPKAPLEKNEISKNRKPQAAVQSFFLEKTRADEARDRFLTTAEAKEIFDFNYTSFRDAKLITDLDVQAFCRWCEAEAECWIAQKVVSAFLARGEMPVLKGKSDKAGIQYHPAWVIRNRAAERADAGATSFGATPSARAKLENKLQLDLFAGQEQEHPLSKLASMIHGAGTNLPANAMAH